jgi:5-methylcytosine-specific restriction endonuclease McrA
MDCYLKAVSKYKEKEFVCKYCGQKFKSKNAYRGFIPKYCSARCMKEDSKGRIGWNKGKKLSDDHRVAISEGRKKSLKCKGPNLYNWKGGDATYKERRKVYCHNRRVREKNGGLLNPTFLNYLLEAQKGLCFYCEKPLTDDNDKCLEHLTPLSKGGGNQPFNLVFSCRSCNSKKRQMTLEDYAITNGKIWLVDKWEDIFVNAYWHTKEAQCNTEN